MNRLGCCGYALHSIAFLLDAIGVARPLDGAGFLQVVGVGLGDGGRWAGLAHAWAQEGSGSRGGFRSGGLVAGKFCDTTPQPEGGPLLAQALRST